MPQVCHDRVSLALWSSVSSLLQYDDLLSRHDPLLEMLSPGPRASDSMCPQLLCDPWRFSTASRLPVHCLCTHQQRWTLWPCTQMELCTEGGPAPLTRPHVCFKFGFDLIPYGRTGCIPPKVPVLYFWWCWLRIASTLQKNGFIPLNQTLLSSCLSRFLHHLARTYNTETYIGICHLEEGKPLLAVWMCPERFKSSKQM